MSRSFLFQIAKEKMIKFATLSLSKNTALIFILVFTALAVLDSMIVEFSTYSGVRIPTWLNIAVFVIFSIIFVVGGTILLNSVRKTSATYAYKQALPFGIKYFQVLIGFTLILTVAIILAINLQMILVNKYSLFLLNVQTYLSHLSALAFLSPLAFLFASWLGSAKRNYVILMYTISFSLVSCNLVVSLIYLDSYLTGSGAARPDIRPYPITRYVTDSGGSTFTGSLSVLFDALSISSFLFMWGSTAILLGQYRFRMGRLKYAVLMGVPLIYYIFPFQGYFGDVLFPLLLTSPIAVSIIYVLFFSATKQVGLEWLMLIFLPLSPMSAFIQLLN
ncbi:MAG TPA: hypothetical protein VFS97_07495 [Nitrososphaeraceae archaeon]|nr:hypothetical protein [Nitrososphaeraceae archaeon]